MYGLVRQASALHTQRLEHLCRDPHAHDTRLLLRYGDLSDSSQLTNLFYEIQPDEVYHLGAQSHVGLSFELPSYTGDVTGLSSTRLLEAIRGSGVRCRFYQASTSEMFGDDSRYVRPNEVPCLRADASEAKRCLGREPRVRFRDLVRIVVDADMEAVGLATSGNATPKFDDGHLAWLQRP